MKYAVSLHQPSRSFPDGDAFLDGASAVDDAEVLFTSPEAFEPDPAMVAIVVELRDEELGNHLVDGRDVSNVVGFARYRNGSDAPSSLVELVRHPATAEAAVEAARAVLAQAGLEVVVCADQAGRIINRLVIPKYNAALRFLDEGLATQSDLDLTCKLGLGYPDGPVERIERGGLTEHYCTSRSLFEAYGTPAYAPAGRARMAFNRTRRT
ncbi:3-hydroxyacyl-CoA dehydrogenase family protein [Bradyrhizobium liaoningense]